MEKTKITKNDREIRALQDFINGMTLPEIASKYKVKERTARGWYERHEWAKKRRLVVREAQASIFNKLQEKVVASTERFLEISKIGSQLVLLRITEIYREVVAETEVKSGILDKNYRALKKWATLAAEFTKVQKGALPQASEELSRMMYEELRRLGDAGLLIKEENNNES